MWRTDPAYVRTSHPDGTMVETHYPAPLSLLRGIPFDIADRYRMIRYSIGCGPADACSRFQGPYGARMDRISPSRGKSPKIATQSLSATRHPWTPIIDPTSSTARSIGPLQRFPNLVAQASASAGSLDTTDAMEQSPRETECPILPDDVHIDSIEPSGSSVANIRGNASSPG